MHDAEKDLDAAAESIADACFAYLVQHPEDLQQFMISCGYSTDSIEKALGTSALNSAMIEYFVQSEPLLLALAANSGLRPERIVAVWRSGNPDS